MLINVNKLLLTEWKKLNILVFTTMIFIFWLNKKKLIFSIKLKVLY